MCSTRTQDVSGQLKVIEPCALKPSPKQARYMGPFLGKARVTDSFCFACLCSKHQHVMSSYR